VLIWDLIETKTLGRMRRGAAVEASTGPVVDAPLAARAPGPGAAVAGRAPRRAPSRPRFGRGGLIDLAAHVALLIMVVWVLVTAQSSTSTVSMILGAFIIVAMRFGAGRRVASLIGHPGTWIVLIVFAVAVVQVGSALVADFSDLVGRDATFTGRTDLWADLMRASINPLLGDGYQSFWLGQEANWLWEKYYFHPNQAHNGYLETYLNGGWLGLALLAALIVSMSARLRKEIRSGNDGAAVGLALLVTCVISNWTEATFDRLSLVWFVLILVALSGSRAGRHRYGARVRREEQTPVSLQSRTAR